MHRTLTLHAVRLVVVLVSILWLGSRSRSDALDWLQTVAQATLTPTFISWQPHVPYERLTLNVALPTGRVVKSEFTPGQPVTLDVIDAQGKPLPDGHYTYELVVAPVLDPSVQAALADAKEPNERQVVIEALQDQGLIPRRPVTQTGFFTITQGAIVP